jgi:predicted AAA+ superfamily ATPase
VDKIFEFSRSLVARIDTTFVRYLYHKIEWNSRMIAILGARGVGKTTLMLQRIKLHHKQNDTLYINADDLYFTENTLFDLASAFYKNGGKYLFIDEVHKYQTWSKELKMMYDYVPDLQVVFTGSSILDIYKGSADLSRRVISYSLEGLSFREYLNMSQGIELPAYTLDEILAEKIELAGIQHPLVHFKIYLEQGCYPFFKQDGYSERLLNIVKQVLDVDIPLYARMNISTASKVRHLLRIIAQSVPFKPNYTKIAELLGVHRNQVVDFMLLLDKAKIITHLREDAKGLRAIGKVEKVYLNNTNILHALAEGKPETGNLRETFFLHQMNPTNQVLASRVSDFQIGDYTFEVGGKNKKQKQIKEITNAFLVKDDIEYGYGNTIPLWLFGFTY